MMDVVRGCRSAQFIVDKVQDVRNYTTSRSDLEDGASWTSYVSRGDVPGPVDIL